MSRAPAASFASPAASAAQIRSIPPRRSGDACKFAFELLEKAGVGVAPGVDFSQVGKRAVRFSYASSEDNIRAAPRRLGEYLGRKG